MFRGWLGHCKRVATWIEFSGGRNRAMVGYAVPFVGHDGAMAAQVLVTTAPDRTARAALEFGPSIAVGLVAPHPALAPNVLLLTKTWQTILQEC